MYLNAAPNVQEKEPDVVKISLSKVLNLKSNHLKSFKMRIAVTTTDGKKVDQHFGKATSFNIYEMENGTLKMVDLRDVESYCECVNGVPVDPNHKFSSDRFSLVKETIKDCTKLYTVQIGEKPKEQLENAGIEVQLCNCKIDNIAGCKGECK